MEPVDKTVGQVGDLPHRFALLFRKGTAMFRQMAAAWLRKWVPASLRQWIPLWLRNRLRPLFRKPERRDPRQTFCILAWKHLQINPEGTVKLCCRAESSACDAQGHHLSLDAHSVKEIWNSPYMQTARRKMVQGELLGECGSCYAAEAAGVNSYRTQSNEKWLGKEGRRLEEAIADARARLRQPVELPVFYQLNLGNLCNLKCRMCSSSYSSQIEADPVHSVWSPRNAFNDSGLARWHGETLHLRPGQIIDLKADETSAGGQTKSAQAWTGGAALSLTLSPLDVPTELRFKVRVQQPRQRVRVILNDTTLHEGIVDAPDWPEVVDLRQRNLQGRLELKIANVPDGLWTKAPELEEVVLRRTLSSARKAGFSNVAVTRFNAPGDWHRQDSVIFGEILENPDQLEELYFTGGEPLISPKFREIVRTLVDRGVAQRLTLQLNSNITILSDELLAQLAKFKQVTFTLSIDAAYQTYEYIRYPAKWPVVAENVRRLAATLTNADFCAIPVLTAYNLLYLPDLFRFLDTLNIKFQIIHCSGPEWLGIHVLPQPVMAEAVRRYQRYLQSECRDENRFVVQAWTDALASGRVEFRPASYQVFNEFTNDLDVSRGQDFAAGFLIWLNCWNAAATVGRRPRGAWNCCNWERHRKRLRLRQASGGRKPPLASLDAAVPHFRAGI